MTDVTKMTDAELMAYLNTPEAAQAPPQDVGYGPGVRAPDASTGRGVDVWRGSDQEAAPVGQPAIGPVAPATPQQVATPTPDTDREGIGAWLDNRITALARGVPVAGAFADEANAYINAGAAPIVEPALRRLEAMGIETPYDERYRLDNAGDFGDRVKASQNLQRFRTDQFDQAHPKESLGLQIGGGIAGTVAALPFLGGLTAAAGPEAGLLLRSGAGAVEGAGIGAAHGYGAGAGEWDDPSRKKGAMVGAGVGAAAGGAFPIVGDVAKAGWKATGGRMVDALRGTRTVQAPAPEAAEALVKALRSEEPQLAPMPMGEANPSRDALEAALVASRRPELTARASEVDDAYVRIARAVERGRMTPEQAAERVQTLGPHGVLADASPATQDLLRAAMNRPGKASGIAKDNLTPRQQGVFNKETGDYDVRPSSMRITDKAAEGLGVGDKQFGSELEAIIAQRKAAADPLYTKMREAAPVPTTTFADFAASPLFADAYDGARAISQKAFVKLPDGTEKIVPLPAKVPDQLDWRTLDLMKQAMDDTISTAPQQGIGATSRGASKGYLARFVEKLDGLNPDYKAARDSFAGDSAMKDALEEGRKLLREDAYAIGRKMGDMSESERQMTRLGALQELKTKLGNANVTFDAANQAGLLKPNQLARFKELFPDRKAFADFITTMENEKAMFGTNASAFGNSTTAKQLMHVAEASDPQMEGAGQVTAGAIGLNPMAIIQGIRRMGLESPMNEGVAETIASVLTNVDAAAMPGFVAKMNEAQKRAMMADILRNSQGVAGGQAGAAVARPKD